MRHLGIAILLLLLPCATSGQNSENQRKLFLAARDSGPRFISHLIKGGADKNAQDSLGRTALHIAAENCRIQVVESLVKDHRVGLDLQDNEGRTPIFVALARYAQEKDCRDATHFLMEKGASISFLTDSGDSLLSIAARRGYLHLVKALLQKGANINHLGATSETPLSDAIKNENVNISTYLKSAGALTTAELQLEFLTAAENRDVALFKRIASSNPKVLDLHSDVDGYAIHIATRNSDISLIRAIASLGGTLEARHQEKTVLQYASSRGDLAVVRALLELGADTKVADKETLNTPLHYAVEQGNAEMASSLLAHAVDVNAQNHKGQTALHLAVARSHYELSRMLVDHGASADVLDDNGNTPFLTALKGEHADIIELLRANGASPQFSRSYEGQFFLLCDAIEDGHDLVAEVLISQNLDLLYASKIQALIPAHPLDLAVIYGRREIASLILARDDVTLSRAYVSAILVGASYHGWTDIARSMLDAGVDPNQTTHHRITPLEAALVAGHYETAELLRANGGKIVENKSINASETLKSLWKALGLN